MTPDPAPAGPPLMVRAAESADWPAIWGFMRVIVAAGETFGWDPDTSEEDARATWMGPAPRCAAVAVLGDEVVGSATMGPNHGGPGSHVATASFMVDPARTGLGVGRALGEHVLGLARERGFRAMQFNAVAETNVAAVHLWRSIGMEVPATIPEAFHHPTEGYVGLHVMHRALTTGDRGREPPT